MNEVAMYHEDGHYRDSVHFRYRWQARLFHLLLNLSLSHNGARLY